MYIKSRISFALSTSTPSQSLSLHLSLDMLHPHRAESAVAATSQVLADERCTFSFVYVLSIDYCVFDIGKS